MILIGQSVTRVKLRNASLSEIETTQWRSQEKRGLKFQLLYDSKKLANAMFRFQNKSAKIAAGVPIPRIWSKTKNDDFTVVPSHCSIN